MAEKTLTLGTLFVGKLSPEFQKAINQLKGAVGSVNTALGGTTKASKKTESAMKKTTTAMAGAGKETKKLGKNQQWMGKQISKVHGGVERLKAAMKVTASYGLAATAIFSVVNAMKAGVSEIVNYDQALKNLQAITGATNAEIDAMSDTLKNVARTTKFSTTETAEGMVLLGQAGFDAGESMDAMQAVANLATGTLSSMQLVTDLLTTAVRAFSMNALESSRVADVMANAINKSKLTIDKLRIAFSFVGATASQVGLTIEETAASMMVLANNGLRASTIGTGLRQVLSKLIAPNARLREAFEAHSIALDKINPAVVGYQEALKNLSAILWDSEKRTVDMSKAFELFQLRGAQAAAILIKSFVRGEFVDALDKVYEVGTAAAMAAKQQEGLGVRVKNLADRWKLFGLAIGEGGVAGGLGVLINMAGRLGTLLEFLAKTIAGQVVIQFTLWTGAIWLNIIAVKSLLKWIGTTGLIRYFKALRREFVLVQSAMIANTTTIKLLSMSLKTMLIDLKAAIVAHPLLAIAAAIGAIATALYFFITATDRSIKQAQKQAVEYERLVSSLRAYGGALESLHKRMEKGEDVGKEYRATLNRLVAEHKDLAEAIDINVDSYEEIAEALEKAEFEKQEKAIERYSKIILENEKRVSSLKEFYDEFTISVGMGAHSMDELIARFPKVARWVTDTNEALEKWIGIQAEMVVSGDKTKDAVADLIKEFFVGSEKAEKTAKVLELLNKAIQNLEDSAKIVGKEFKEFLETAPDDFQAFYYELDIQRKLDFARAWQALDNAKAALRDNLEKRLNLVEASGEKRTAIEGEINRQLKALEGKFWMERITGHKNVMDALISQEEELASEIERIQNKISDIHEHGADVIRTLQKNLMTAEEKYQFDRERAEELRVMALNRLRRGEFDEADRLAREYYSIVQRLAAKDVVERKELGQKMVETTIMTGEAITKALLPDVEEFRKEYDEVAKAMVKPQEAQLAAIRKTIPEAERWLERYSKAVKIASDVRFDLDNTRVLNSIDHVIAKLHEYMALLATPTEIGSRAPEAIRGIPGRQHGGFIPGTGIGDKILSWLAPGEFVFSQRAVKAAGAGFLEWFHNLLRGFKSGGVVTGGINKLSEAMNSFQSGGLAFPKMVTPQLAMQTGGQVKQELPFSGMLHTINLIINNTPHMLFGEENTVRSLEKTLRREGLMTA